MASPPMRLEAKGADLLRLFDWAGATGMMNVHTANQYRTACTRVLTTIPGGATADMASLDVQAALREFRDQFEGRLAPNTLDTYQSIFARAVSSLLSYVRDPDSWQPPVAFTKGRWAMGVSVPGRTGLEADLARLAAGSTTVDTEPSERGAQGSRPGPPAHIEMTLRSGHRVEVNFPDGAIDDDYQHLVRLLPSYMTRNGD